MNCTGVVRVTWVNKVPGWGVGIQRRPLITDDVREDSGCHTVVILINEEPLVIAVQVIYQGFRGAPEGIRTPNLPIRSCDAHTHITGGLGAEPSGRWPDGHSRHSYAAVRGSE